MMMARFRYRTAAGIITNRILPLLACLITSIEANGQTNDLKVGGVELKQVFHSDRLTGTNDHFGALLFDSNGHLAKHHENKTWLYCGAKEGQWKSFVREFDLDLLQVSERTKVLDPYQSDRWASVHLAIKASDEFFILFYSTGKRVRAAVASKPKGPFVTDEHFRIGASQPWEKGCSIESDCGFVKIFENEDELRIWKLYDTLCSGSTGQNGWAEIRIDKQTRGIELLRKHPENPIRLLRPDWAAARTGGNLDSRIRFNGLHPLFYLSKRVSSSYRIAVALSSDPLFQDIEFNKEVAGPIGTEGVIEKFQFYRHDGHLFLIYENADRRNDWRTSIRKYRLVNGCLD
tara:strand:+ start:17103 stop:18140 length:1038 start_codon:yes stop_codon:yes gene_type:complete